MPVTSVYSDFNGGNEVYFLNGNNEEVKVRGIEKVPYNGKIYDVDVGNDIVLVRRLGDGVINDKENYVNDDSANNNGDELSINSGGDDYVNNNIQTLDNNGLEF